MRLSQFAAATAVQPAETLESLLNSQGFDLGDAEAVAIAETKATIDDCTFTVYEYPSYEFNGSWFWDSENGTEQAKICRSVAEYLAS